MANSISLKKLDGSGSLVKNRIKEAFHRISFIGAKLLFPGGRVPVTGYKALIRSLILQSYSPASPQLKVKIF